MRWKFALVGLLLVGASASTVAMGQGGDQPIKPLSVRLAQAGQAALAKGQASAAVDQFETALAVDPRNSDAFIGLARASEAMGLHGQAVKYYREALTINPNDLAALEGQGAALVARGAKNRAQANLERIRQLCKSDCQQARRLATLIAQAPAATQTAASTAAPSAPAAQTPAARN